MSEQPQIENKTTALAIAYETDYTIEDDALAEPFAVLKAISTGRPAWWNGNLGRKKVERLIDAFKTDLKLDEAFIFAGITHGQYRYFCEVHEAFSMVKARCRKVMEITAKRGLVADIKDPDGARNRQWFLERKQPETYGRDIGAANPPPAGATAKITAEAFLDEHGNMIVSKQTAELLKKEHGNDDNPQGAGPEPSA